MGNRSLCVTSQLEVTCREPKAIRLSTFSRRFVVVTSDPREDGLSSQGPASQGLHRVIPSPVWEVACLCFLREHKYNRDPSIAGRPDHIYGRIQTLFDKGGAA